MLLLGAAYMVAVPGVVMATLAAARAALPVGETVASVGSLVGAVTVCARFALIGYDALGDTSLVATAALLALVTTTFAP
jgi:hypothetical protein